MPENSKGKQANRGRFKKGQSGNPAGKPKGATNLTTRAVRELLDGEAEALTRKAVELALEGDTTALRLCLERVAPPMKDKPIIFDLPEIKSMEDASKAMGALLRAVATGDITPSEAGAVSGIVETFRRTIETADLEQRIAALEERQGA